jgi:hypothetical protein
MSENDEHRSEETSQPVEAADRYSSHSRDKGRWGRPSASNLRRTAARIRSGAFPIRNPELQPLEFADLLDEIASVDFFESLKTEALDSERLHREYEAEERAEREQDLVAELCHLKKLPEARDPESEVAKKVRELHHLRKNELGRPRKRKKKG